MQMKITDDDITALRKEIKATLDESSQSKWSLDMPHIINGCVRDVRTLEPNADQCSLYWYASTMTLLNPDVVLADDPIYNELADRAAFGFSLQNALRKEEKNTDDLVNMLPRMVIECNTQNEQKTKHHPQLHKNAAIVIQRFVRKRMGVKRMTAGRSGKSPMTKVDTIRQIQKSNSTKLCPTNKVISYGTQTAFDDNNTFFDRTQVPSTARMHSILHGSDQVPPSSPNTSITNVNQTSSMALPAVQSNKNESFVDIILSKIHNSDVDDSSMSMQLPCHVSLPCRRVREIFRPLVDEFLKAGIDHGVTDPSVITNVITCLLSSRSEPVTSASFAKSVLSIAASLSDSLISVMGGPDVVMKACVLVYKHFGNDLSFNGLDHFLRDVEKSGNSRASALF
eukprot:scaffold30613_cov20-Cyclotella_meneghiniana.AAC.1